jgi:hypothetical protein
MTTMDLELTGSPSDSVREIETPDGAALLDIQQGLCLSLNPVAMRIWRGLKLQKSLDQITDDLATEFREISRQQIRGDVFDFVSDIRQKCLLVLEEKAAARQYLSMFFSLLQTCGRAAEKVHKSSVKSSGLLMVKAFFGLLAFDAFRFGTNFARIHAGLQGWPVAHRTTPADTVDRVCRAINYACVWYPKRVLCLQRSAVTTCLLRSFGVPAQMVIGAQKFPFEAHAWTEVEGRPINEGRDVRRIYLIWERC